MNQNVVYVKFPLYVQQFLRERYTVGGARGVDPIPLNPEMHPGGVYLYRHLDSNPMLEAWTMLCVSRQMYELHPSIAPPEFLSVLPSVEYRRFYLPFTIQPAHYYRGRWIPGDKTCMMRDEEARAFRQIIMDEFWADFDHYTAQWKANPDIREGRHNDEFNCMEGYMESRCISQDCEEAFQRVLHRRKHNAVHAKNRNNKS